MQDTSKTLQRNNAQQFIDLAVMVEFVHSPYAFSLSFLKEPQLIGKEDEFGQNKYKINLDEELVEEFYSRIREHDQKHMPLNDN
jgi:hypothetical protein